MGGLWLGIADTYKSSDALILASPEIYEPESIAATKEWFAETGRPVWAIGPLYRASIANSKEAVAKEESLSENAAEIRKFLDDTLALRGEHSMVFVRQNVLKHPGLF